MSSLSLTFKKLKKTVAFSSEESPTDWLTIAYIIAFVPIALLTFFSHNMMAHLTARPIEGKQVSYELSQAMGVVRQIGTSATTYYNNQEEFDRDALLRSVEILKQSQKIVNEYLANDSYSNDAKKTLYTNFYGEPFYVNDKLDQYLKPSTLSCFTARRAAATSAGQFSRHWRRNQKAPCPAFLILP